MDELQHWDRRGKFGEYPAQGQLRRALLEDSQTVIERSLNLFWSNRLSESSTPRDKQIAYLKMKVEEGDWHAVSDAANDLRVMEARGA